MSLEIRGLGLDLLVEGEVRTVLEPTSLVLRPGEVLGITGPSGAGKSILLRLISGLQEGSGGAVSLEGRAVGLKEWPAFRRQVAFLPQLLPPLPGRPQEFFERVARFRIQGARMARERLGSELTALGLVESLLARDWRTLSGGETRRLHLALLLAWGPAYLLLDEPTFGLDPASEELLVAGLRQAVARGLGVLVASHQELLLARLASRLMVFYDGRLQGEGTPRELIPAALLEAQRGQAS